LVDVTIFENVALPADRVWSVIGDFAHSRKWATAVQSESAENIEGRRVRTLTMPDGGVVRESLAHSSTYSYTYAMVDRPELSDYRGTIAVIPLDASHCRIELIVHVSTMVQDEEKAIAGYTRFLKGNLRAMKKALGLA
jgi:hypothetical protein